MTSRNLLRKGAIPGRASLRFLMRRRGTQRTHNPLVAGSIPAGPTAISAGHVLYSDSPGDSKGADRTPRVCPLSARLLCPPDSLHDSLPVCGAAPCAAPESGRSAARAISPPHLDSINFRRRPGVFVIGRGHFPGRGADDRRRGHRTSTRSPCPRETRASPRRRRRSSATTLRPSLLPLLRAGRVRSDGLRQQLVQQLLILSAESGKR